MPSVTFERICAAITRRRVHVSEHAYDEAVEEELQILEVIEGTPRGEVIEDYPQDPRSPSCLVLLQASSSGALHAVWAFDPGPGRAILVTVYRPDPARWSDDLKTRRQRT